jgi:hypothetical protein
MSLNKNKTYLNKVEMRKFFILITILFGVAQGALAHDDAQPWCFWYWMYGAVSKAGIHEDLQGMKDIGLGGTYLMPIKSPTEKPEYGGKAEQLSPDFWDMVKYSIQQADSLGLQLGVHVCDGFALAGGPWITEKESMQKIVYADTIVEGPLKTITMPIPHAGYYEDIACFALPAKTIDRLPSPEITCSPSFSIDDKGVIKATEPGWITYDFTKSVTVRNIEVAPGSNNFQSQRFKIYASDDGKTFRFISQMVPPRQGWQNSGYNVTFAFAPTTARYFRLEWSPEGTEPGSEDLDAAKWKPNLKVNAIVFHGSPRIGQWEGKAGYVWRIAAETSESEVPQADCTPLNAIIRLQMDGNRVVTPLPKGRWRILRMGHSSTNQMNATAGGGKGLEVDKFSADAVNKQIDNWFGHFMALDSTRRALRYMHVDSWECGCQNWGSDFAGQFLARRGYDLLPYLPVMVGIPVQSAAASEKVLRDVRTTVNDLINDVFFATVHQRAARYGVLLSSESVAPTMTSDGMEHYKNVDIPMGEYWLNSPTHDKPNDMLDAISGAHVYGKKIVQAEGFTEVRGVWNESPSMLKTLLDRNLALGMNRLFFHVTAHNPWLNRRPGMTLDGIGLYFQRNQTWYPEASAMVDYVTRCQRLLQEGRPVADIAVFTGEEMPRRAVLPERLVNTLPGLFGDARVAEEKARMANINQLITESPVGVYHSSGIVDTKDWVNPLHGYAYDSFNPDVITHYAKAENGNILLPDGAKYRILVLQRDNPMNPSCLPLSKEVSEKVAEFRNAGVVIVDSVYRDNDFSRYGLLRDVVLPADIAYVHRSLDDAGDIYFLSNQRAEMRSFKACFRCSGRQPMLYDALEDKYLKPDSIDISRDYTGVGVTLQPNGSLFVIFSNADSIHPVSQMKCNNSQPLSVDKWKVTFKENGTIVSTDRLFDWSTSTDDKVKYYSGHAMYESTFRVSGEMLKRKCLKINLGTVCDVAHVWINGKDCGIVWTPPMEVDISDAVKKGKNNIRVEVVNTWANALRGADEGRPPFDGIWTNAKYRMKSTQLLPAGLLGPINIKY